MDEDLHSPLLPELGFDVKTLITPADGLWERIVTAVLDPTTPLLDNSTVPGADTHIAPADDPPDATTTTEDAESHHDPLLDHSDTFHHTDSQHLGDDHTISHHDDHHSPDGHGW